MIFRYSDKKPDKSPILIISLPPTLSITLKCHIYVAVIIKDILSSLLEFSMYQGKDRDITQYDILVLQPCFEL